MSLFKKGTFSENIRIGNGIPFSSNKIHSHENTPGTPNFIQITNNDSTDGLLMGVNGLNVELNNQDGDVIIKTTGTSEVRLDSVGNFSVGNAALGTSATDGFLYLAGSPGIPSGVPTTKTGLIATTFDTVSNRMYASGSGSDWKDVIEIL
jgi:hypothetical protein